MPFERHTTARAPAVISCSEHVFPRPTDWNPHIHQHGYWFTRDETAFVPSAELTAFLDHHDTPVFVGFGSMTGLNRYPGLAETVVAAIQRSGRRAVIQGIGEHMSLPHSMLRIDAVPHSWLFPRVSAVCHHGGAGTTAAALRAGVPSIVVPFANDQYAWGHRVHDIGVGPAPIPRKHLTAVRLAEACAETADPQMRRRAAQVGAAISAEQGAAACAAVIASIR